MYQLQACVAMLLLLFSPVYALFHCDSLDQWDEAVAKALQNEVIKETCELLCYL